MLGHSSKQGGQQQHTSRILNNARNLAAKTLLGHMPKGIDLCIGRGRVVMVWQ
jgi:hypothetical protein